MKIDFFQSNSIPYLCEEDKFKCEGFLTIGECYNVLNNMSSNKSPGNDGLSSEWYWKFWNVIGNFLVDVLNTGLRKGELSSSQKQAVITLIEKEGKDRCKLKNWRPISLLNVDYKIASKVLASRICKVIPNLINSDQSGFVKGRFIGESIRTIADIINYTKYKDIPGLLLFLDFEKAFDSLEWDFLFKVLERMNFGSDFVSHVKSLYKNISSCVMNNGLASNYFTVGRGVRQGDPLSPYLFILAIELLSCTIRDDNTIEGILINDVEIKIVQYADDSTCVVKNKKSAENVFALIDAFTMISGLKLNINKSQGMWIGSQRLSLETPFNINWPKEPIKALGVYFSYDDVAAEKNNFEPKIKQLKSILNIWKSRRLTLLGKILLVKTFALSQLIFLASVTSVPGYVIHEVEKIIYDFIWNGGKGMIKRSTLINNIEDGGLKMVDIKSMFKALQIKWVQRFNDSIGSSAWKNIFKEFIAPYGGDLIFYCNLTASQVKLWKNIPLFYKNIIISYIELVQPDKLKVGCQCVWYNHHMLINGKPYFYKKFHNIGIKLISDLFNEDGKLVPFSELTARGLPKDYYLHWRGIIMSIPTDWKQVIKQGFNRDDNISKGFIVHNKGEETPIDKLPTKMLYQFFIQKLKEIPSSQNKYEEFGIKGIEWGDIYSLPFRACHDIRIRIFQYKINMNCLMTNSRLYKMRIINNEECSLCNSYKETMKHLFYECVHVDNFWTDFKNWWEEVSGNKLYLDYKSIVFGIVHADVQNPNLLLNLCIILVKKVIYNCRFHKQKPTFNCFLNLIRFIYKVEKNIAVERNTMYKFQEKWNINCTFN